jgi:hypothetical protein
MVRTAQGEPVKGFFAGIIATVLVTLFGAERVAGFLDSMDQGAKRAVAAFEEHRAARQRHQERPAPVWRRRAP